MNRWAILIPALTMIGCGGGPVEDTTAGEPMASFTQQALFEAGSGGYTHYRIPAVVVTQEGSVLVFTEARVNPGGDWGPIDILMRRSTDGGATFDEPRKIVEVEGEIQQNPVALAQDLAKPGEVTYNNFRSDRRRRRRAARAVLRRVRQGLLHAERGRRPDMVNAD